MLLKKLYRRFRPLQWHARALAAFAFYKPLNQKNNGTGKTLFLNISHNPFGRYLYTFLKYFQIEGYQIYLPKKRSLLASMQRDTYAALLLKEKLVRFGTPPKQEETLVIEAENITADYFMPPGHQAPEPVYVSMPQHPLMYHKGWWNEALVLAARKRSLFMTGNFEPESYRQLERDGIFNVLSRSAVYNVLEKKGLLYNLQQTEDLQTFLNTDAIDNQVLLVNRLLFDVPMPELRNVLNRFYFYFALPGVAMPFSHNIVEAMSAGCIPFLQAGYAALFYPALIDGIHCITFESAADLPQRIEALWRLTETEIGALQQQVSAYYENHMTPRSVVQTIEKAAGATIYLHASTHSVELLKMRMRK